jgi:nucleotide-binding universal stress UspA family protein
MMPNQTTIIPAYQTRQALIGLSLSERDTAVLAFFRMWVDHIPVESAYFLHIVPDFSKYVPFPEEVQPSWEPDYEIGEELTHHMKQQVDRQAPNLEKIFTEFDVKEGDPLEELLLTQRDQQADLTFIGQQSGTPYHQILARNLARKVQGNALIIPEHTNPQLKHIMVPLDFSNDSIFAFETALAIAQEWNSPVEISAVHVFDLPDLSVYKISRTPEQFKHMMVENREEAFEAFLKKYAIEDTHVQVNDVLLEQEHPQIAQTLFEHAKKQAVDLIVMGAKGHSKVELLLMGSVTEQLLSLNDEIPTLIVKKKDS